MTHHYNRPDGERLARIEALMESAQASFIAQNERTQINQDAVIAKIDLLDSKMEARFQAVEGAAHLDAKELQALKNTGAGVLAALGVVFTAAATIFSSFFSSLKEVIFG